MVDLLAAGPGRRGLVPAGAAGQNLGLVRVDDRFVDAQDLLGPYLTVRRYVAAGAVVLAAMVGGFTAWSVFAPLASGAIAPGVIGVESNRKTIQHLEGGIIRTIHVREGDEVTAGAPLITLDDIQARATAGVIRAQLLTAAAHEARLITERDGRDAIGFPAELLARQDDPSVAEILASHRDAFTSQRTALEGKRQIFRRQIRQFDEEIASLTAQIAAYDEQLRLIALETDDVQRLVDQGLERRPRLLGLQRNAAALSGERESSRAMIARAQQQIAEIGLQMIDLDTTRHSEVAEELRGVQEQLADLRERARATEDTLSRTVVLAPRDGTVVRLQVFTIGGVIAPGAPLLDLVPKDDLLIITARVQPQDRQGLHPGLLAHVVLTGLNRRTTPILDGEVFHVSADRVEDPRTGDPYFETRVRIGADQLARLEGVRLTPGMPAEVKIVTGERSALQYLTEPLTATLRRAFVNH